MLSKINFKYLKLGCIAGVVVIVDQITKAVIINKVPVYHSISVIPGFFNITHIRNSGGAFGFLANQRSEWFNLFFLFVSVSALFLWRASTGISSP